MTRSIDKKTRKPITVMSRSEIAVKISEYFVSEYGSCAEAARNMGMTPQQLHGMLTCKTMITKQVLSKYSENVTRETKTLDTYVVY